MPERTLQVLDKSGISITRTDGTATSPADVLDAAQNGDAFSWQTPNDLAFTFSGATTSITFNDSDGVLTDEPLNGAQVTDQQLTQPVTINGTTYTPSSNDLRWQTPPAVYLENEYEVTLYDSSGTAYRMVAVAITQGYTTTVVGVMFDGLAPTAGTTLYYRQGTSAYGGSGQSLVIPDEVVCFLAGTRIDTPRGPVRIEELRIGDLVTTHDRGAQPIRWIGRSVVPATGRLAPIRIASGAIGNKADLLVSPNHRLFLQSPLAELYFGCPEVLVAAKFLTDDHLIRREPMPSADYLHLMLDSHEMVIAEGIASESFHPGAAAIGALAPAARRELLAVFGPQPWLARPQSRPSLKRAEARLLCHRAATVRRTTGAN